MNIGWARRCGCAQSECSRVLLEHEGRSGLIDQMHKAQERQLVEKIIDAVYAEKKKRLYINEKWSVISRS